MSRTTEELPAAPATATRRGWLAVYAVAVATFADVTSEMLPIGLLTPIGTSMHVTDGVAGLVVTVPGIVAAVSAPAVTLGCARVERRLLLCALIALLLVANAVSALAPNFAVLLAARVLVGVSIGGVWSIVASLVVRLVPERNAGTATSLAFSGIAVASVLGVPAGTQLGEIADWRAGFTAMAALSALVLAALWLTMPRLPVTRPARLDDVPALLRDTRVRGTLVVTLSLVTGHFAAYTYIRPVLEDVSGITPTLISALLLGYGLAGVASNFLAGATATRDPRRTLLALTGLLAASILLAPVIGRTVPGAIALVVAWGLGYGGVSVTAQTWLLALAPQARESASSLFVAVFNAAIALGALVGGRVLDAFSLTAVLWCGGALAALALLAMSLSAGARRGRDRAVLRA
ncbi:MFS transporter [Streptomyces sp. NPDC057654]|uniref:MFS transporter n=1 Tax=Streptomyces sp. NPDC057654 TaxID=3346196 RepID=UPI0036884F7B